MQYATMEHFMELAKLPFISSSVFIKHRKKWLFPVIYRMYTSQKNATVSRLIGLTENLVLCGDAQFDSPGYFAKFCTYSIMNCKTSELVDIVIIQKGQLQGKLETQACQLLLDILVNEVKLDIGIFVTDRHKGIGAMMRIRFPDILGTWLRAS